MITYTIAVMEISEAGLLSTAWGIPVGIVITAVCIFISMGLNKLQKAA